MEFEPAAIGVAGKEFLVNCDDLLQRVAGIDAGQWLRGRRTTIRRQGSNLAVVTSFAAIDDGRVPLGKSQHQTAAKC